MSQIPWTPPRLADALMLAGVAAVAASQPGPAHAQTAGNAIALAPHRAIYDFTLGNVRPSNSITALSGRMVYELTGSTCDGFTQTMRFVTRTSGQDGATAVSDQRSTSWEDEAARSYRFQSSQYRDQKLVEQAAGTAKRGAKESDIIVDLTHPEPRKAAIGADAVFPIQHSRMLIEAARSGRTSFKADFFDGSEGGEKTYVISASIGRQVATAYNKSLPRVGQADKLDGMPAWPVALSYYEQGSERKDAVPVYEMSFLIFSNGVSRKLMIDNGEYSMKGELTEFTLLDPTPCRK